MERLHPVRLTNEQYMEGTSPFRIFRHSITLNVDTHWHEFFEVSLIIDGEGIHTLNGRPQPIRQGAVLIMTPADFHEVAPVPGGKLELYNMIFTDTMIRPELFQTLFSHKMEQVCALSEVDYPLILREFERIWKEYNKQQFGSFHIIRGAVERILIDCARISGTSGHESSVLTADGPASAIRKAILYLQYHFREPVTLAEVARQSGFSANYFSERFHQTIGIPFQQYLQELRIQFAASLLRVTDLPITEISYASGFLTISHFGCVFKQKMTVSPKEYRRMKARQDLHMRSPCPPCTFHFPGVPDIVISPTMQRGRFLVQIQCPV